MAPPAFAACPPVPDTGAERAALHTELLRARSEQDAAVIANRLWEIWMTAPDARSQELLDRAMERRNSYDYAGSEELLDDLIAYCPDYAEGYNQRAFSRFLRNNFDGSLEDIDRVLTTNPYHFGALSGKALNLMRQGRMELAQKTLRRAVKVHPFLNERHFLIEDPEKDI